MITDRNRTRTWPRWLELIYPGSRHKIGRLFALSNCRGVNLQAETVAHRLRTRIG